MTSHRCAALLLLVACSTAAAESPRGVARPTVGQCAAGEVAPALQAYCAHKSGTLQRVLPLLQGRPYATAPLHSCELAQSDPVGIQACHPATLVTDLVTGTRYVVDNGRVFDAATSSPGRRYLSVRPVVPAARPIAIALETQP